MKTTTEFIVLKSLKICTKVRKVEIWAVELTMKSHEPRGEDILHVGLIRKVELWRQKDRGFSLVRFIEIDLEGLSSLDLDVEAFKSNLDVNALDLL